jgi:peptidoglycan/xylan/chitin deacetylase (PgdA/CDA1 family)
MVSEMLYVAGALAGVPLLTGLCAAGLAMRRSGRVPPAGITVHALSRRSPIDCSWTAPSTLDQLLGSSRFTWRTVSDLPPRAQTGAGAPPRALCFDEAHESVYSHALPLLTRHGVRATVFVIAGQIGKHTHGNDVYGRQRFMSVAHLREWVQAGHEAGSHTMSHAALTFLDKRDVLRELAESRNRLEDALGVAVTALSFPYGCWNTRVWDLARELGYQRATVARGHALADAGMVRVSPVHAFDTVADLDARLRGGGALSFARGRVMEQFARGTPLWRFRSVYRLAPRW